MHEAEHRENHAQHIERHLERAAAAVSFPAAPDSALSERELGELELELEEAGEA